MRSSRAACVSTQKLARLSPDKGLGEQVPIASLSMDAASG